MLDASLSLLEDHLLQGTRGLNRQVWRRRILAQLYLDTAILLRQQGHPTHLSFMMQSLLQWPLPGSTTPLRRYKSFASMLEQYFRKAIGGAAA
jgi:hypothetical protein